MRRIKEAAALALGLALLAGCRAQSGAAQGVVTFPETFASPVEVDYGGLALEGTFRRSIAGETMLELTGPEQLSGLRLICAQEELTMEYAGLRFSVDARAQQERAVMKMLPAVLGELSGAAFSHPEGSGPFRLKVQTELGEAEAILRSADGPAPRPTNFVPQEIALEGIGLRARFGG